MRWDGSFLRGHHEWANDAYLQGVPVAVCHSVQRTLEPDHRNARAQRVCKNADAAAGYEKIAETDIVKWGFRKVVFCRDRALAFAPDCRGFKILRAEYLPVLGHYPEIM